MTQKDLKLKELLDKEVNSRNKENELSIEKPDPLFIARKYKDEYIALACALFGYGKASLIIKFLDSLNFELLDENEDLIKKELQGYYYRFQNSDDLINFFIALKRLREENSLNDLFYKAYKNEHSLLEGLDFLMNEIRKVNPYKSQGYNFLVGSGLKRDKENLIKHIGNSTNKRWFMYLRWMIRNDELDMGLWKGVEKKDLIMPLDTHTFNVSKRLGLLKRKTYDLKSAIEVTNKLKQFDDNDPVKYDFAIYRLGQEKIL